MPRWFDPDVLAHEQAKARKTPPQELPITGDFGSYAVVNRGQGLAQSGIQSHNLIHTRSRIVAYDILLGRKRLSRIADLGCGIGLTTNALAQHYPDAEVTGIDVSVDAIEYATRTFPNAHFLEQAISPSQPIGGLFDLILCQEFYPFTRTADRDLHSAFVVSLIDQLAPGGVLLIELSSRDRATSILATIGDIGVPAEIRTLPLDKLFRNFPLFGPTVLLSRLISLALGHPLNKCILIRK